MPFLFIVQFHVVIAVGISDHYIFGCTVWVGLYWEGVLNRPRQDYWSLPQRRKLVIIKYDDNKKQVSSSGCSTAVF